MKFSRLLLSLTLLGAGCSDHSDTSANLNPTPTVHIGVIAPVDGGLTRFGRGIRNSVQLAVNQANANHPLPGLSLAVFVQDDSSNPAKGAAAAQAMVDDPQLIGVVGTYNSGVAATVLPVLAPAHIAMISPANTDPALTLGPDTSQRVRPYANYFRVVVPDSIQGPALAQFAYSQGYRNVAILSEDKSVSTGLSDAFQTAFLALGGHITLYSVAPSGTTDYTGLLTALQATQPDLLFYGGEYQGAALVRDQATGLGFTVPLMGGDGIKDPSYVASAGGASEGDFASSVGAPPDALPNAANYFSAYAAAGYSDPPSDFGPYAYDAANLLIETARGRLTTGSQPDAAFRTGLLADIQNVSQAGITGPLSFDAFGDTKNKVLTVYKVVNGQFVAQSTLTIP